MSRAPDDCLDELLSLLPPGDALPRDPASNVGLLFAPLAAEVAGFEATRQRLLIQTSPINAVELLEDFERVLGPDPCKADVQLQSLDQRQRYADYRWNAHWDATPAALVLAAAAVGVSVTVDTFDPDMCGAGECGLGECGPETEAYGWVVHAPTYALIDGECGASECGDWINEAAVPALDCILGQWVPLHRRLLVVFDGS